MSYNAHNDPMLKQLFAAKPYQGADPTTAKFLFFGLDANFDQNIAAKPGTFSEVKSYLQDGVAYWQNRGRHHPFIDPNYKGSGKRYHERFAKIGFQTQHAKDVSFVELLDVPTYGTSHIEITDLKYYNNGHIANLSQYVKNGAADYVFIPSGVCRILRKTPQFSWLPAQPLPNVHFRSLPIWYYESCRQIVFAPFHLSYRFKDIDSQLKDISMLIQMELKTVVKEISQLDYWVNVIGMLQQNWALIADDNGAKTCTVFFIHDQSEIFDHIRFLSRQEATHALRRNGFARFVEVPDAQEFLAPPQPPFFEAQHGNGPYSSGRFWRS